MGRLACDNIHASEFCTASREREKRGGWRAERGAKLFNNFIVAGRIITILPSMIPRNKTDKEESSVNHFSDL